MLNQSAEKSISIITPELCIRNEPRLASSSPKNSASAHGEARKINELNELASVKQKAASITVWLLPMLPLSACLSLSASLSSPSDKAKHAGGISRGTG